MKISIEFNKVYTYKAPKGVISEYGITQVEQYIARQRLNSEEWEKVNPSGERVYLPILPSDWEWVWVVTKGDYKGTLPKRIAQYYFKNYGIKMPKSVLQQIGNIASLHGDGGEKYRFDFTPAIDWYEGDFGDSGSCYWGSNAGAKQMIMENDGFAIRFYDEYENGMARAWVAEIDKRVYVLWNGYGLETVKIARIMAGHLRLSYKRISLHNRMGQVLWINGHMGYVIGKPSVISGISTHDLDWENIHVDTCRECGREIDEYEVYYGADDNSYCEHCYYEIFDSCERCGETYWRNDIHETDGHYVCEHCRGRYFVECAECDEWVYRDNAVMIKGELYCRNCR